MYCDTSSKLKTVLDPKSFRAQLVLTGEKRLGPIFNWIGNRLIALVERERLWHPWVVNSRQSGGSTVTFSKFRLIEERGGIIAS